MPVLFITSCKTSQHKNVQSSLEQTDLVQNGTLPSNLFGRLVMPVESVAFIWARYVSQSVFHRVIGRKKGYMYINNGKEKLTFRSRVVS